MNTEQLRTSHAEGTSWQVGRRVKTKGWCDWGETILCVQCLLVVGYGLKRIVKATGIPHTTTARYIRRLKAGGPAMECLKPDKTKWRFRYYDSHVAEWRVWLRWLQDRYEKAVDKCLYETAEFYSTGLTARERKAKWVADYQRNKYHTDPSHNLLVKLRRRLRTFVKGGKSVTMLNLIGCSQDELVRHIESGFKDGMSWSNAGQWHIDHIKPCISFDLLNLEERRKCFNWSNLQPLWASDNLRKSDTLTQLSEKLTL